MNAESIDAGVNLESAQAAQKELQRQNERLQLLLNLTSRISSNLELRELLREISANIREVMHCEGVGIYLADSASESFTLVAFDFPDGKAYYDDRIPPLRERREDIPLLARYFTQKFAHQMDKRIETIPVTAMHVLTKWDWPGNVRELANFIERAVILTRGTSLDVPLAELRRVCSDEFTQPADPQRWKEIAKIVKETLNALNVRHSAVDEHAKKQRDAIVRTLTETKGRVGGNDGAAARLGLNRTTLLSRMKRFGINPKQFS